MCNFSFFYLLFVHFLAFIHPETKKIEPVATKVVFQSTDGGNSWQDVSQGLPLKFEPKSIFVDKGVVYIGNFEGIVKSSSNDPRPKWEQEALLNQSVTKFFPGRAGLYARSFDLGILQNFAGSGIWIPRFITLKPKLPRTVLETSETTIFVGTDDGIYKSEDKGVNWKKVSEEKHVSNLLLANGVLIAGNGNGIMRSIDNGEHWNYVLSENRATLKIKYIKNQFVSINFNGNTINKPISNNYHLINRLTCSTDNGSSWNTMDKNLAPLRFISTKEDKIDKVRIINDIEQVGEFLFCSLDGGIYRSIDWGKTWQMVFEKKGNNLFEFAVSGQKIYALSIFSGC
ncbi:MAG: hypothetical protein ABI851_07840 [Saprospiraceae bacterium]